MIGEILATGDEIRSGALIDSNSAHIAEKLEEAGVYVERHHCVGDNLNELVAMVKEISRRADLAVVTGGLGPPSDDRTAEAAANAAGVHLIKRHNIRSIMMVDKAPVTAHTEKKRVREISIHVAVKASPVTGGVRMFAQPGGHRTRVQFSDRALLVFLSSGSAP